jgi:PAS domain S-box-containing protein
MKFATKIFSYIFLSTALIIGGMSTITHFWILNHHMQKSIRHEKELARLVALKSEDYILRNERVELYQFYRSIIKVDPYVEYIFAEKQAEILVHTFDKGVPKGLLSLGPLGDPSAVDISPVTDNPGDLIYHLRIGIGAPAHSVLHFGISDKKIHAEINPHRNVMIIVGCFLLAIVPFGLALFLSRLVSRPLYVLRDGVKRIGSGELDYRLDMPTGDEIEQLVDDINTMAEKLEKSRDGLEGEIAERMQAEGALAKQTELLDNILNNVPHNVFWKDKQSMYLGCNKAFAEAAGLEDPEKVVGKTDYDLPWKKKEADFHRQCDQKVMDTGTPMHDIEGTLTRADGQEKTVITSMVPLKDQKGSVFGVLGIFYDVTERKRMEETIKQTQKMEAIGTLAGGIAHDFNNVLGGIIGYTELAEDDTAPDSPARDHLRQVLQSASRAKDLVRQILTFSRKSQEKRRPIRLSMIVKEEVKLLRSTLPITIEIRQNIDDEDGMVNADPTQLHQIVMNLCTNAAHAMEGREGLLDIALSSIFVTTQDSTKKYHDAPPGPFMELEISDTGTGIDSRIIHRIFEPFFTTKDKEKGTGMGLAVVHGIVKDHGGDIIVESNLGKGTIFTVLLPRVISASDREEALPPAMPTGTERILFVDDEKTLLGLGEKMLGSIGYHVTTLNGSLEALKAYQQSPDSFDIVITDQTMPHLTGYNLAKRILEINPSARIILCTGYSDTMTHEKVEAAGIKALLYKPISKKEIAMLIRKVLDE